LWSQLRRLGVSDLPALVDLLASSATIDAGLTSSELLDLARSIRASNAPSAASLPVRGSDVPAGGAGSSVSMSVNLPVRGEATDAVLAPFGGRLGRDLPVATALPAHAKPPPMPELEPALGLVSPC
jgi:hypothetical protein